MSDLLDVLDVIVAEDTRDESAPWGYTTDTRWAAADLDAAYEAHCRWAEVNLEHGRLGIRRWSHQWSTSYCSARPDGAHPIEVVSVDLSCHHEHRDDCQCVGRGGNLYRAWCGDCERWSGILTTETAAVEEAHDHCWPGWREMPIGADAPREQRWTVAGAPIITARTQHATRPVPGRSPYGGYDLAAPIRKD